MDSLHCKKLYSPSTSSLFPHHSSFENLLQKTVMSQHMTNPFCEIRCTQLDEILHEHVR